MTQFTLNPFATAPNVRTRWIPEVDDRMRPKFERLAAELDLIEVARRNAVLNKPDKDDTALDEPQQGVVAAIKEGVNLLRQFLLNQLGEAENKIRARVPKMFDGARVIAEARASAAEVKNDHTLDLETQRLNERLKDRQLRSFRHKNGLLEIEAAYAEVALWPIAILVILVALEGLVNATLLMRASDDGFVGGARLALLYAAINLAVAFATGWLGLRSLNHRLIVVKAAGAVVTVFGVAVGLWWNFTIARLRDTLERSPDAELSFALDPFSTAFHGQDAVALLLLGSLFAIVAMLHGRGGAHSLDDPNWNYRTHHRAHRIADDGWRDAIDTYRTEAREAIESTRGAMRETGEAESKGLREAQEIAEQAAVRVAEVHDSIKEWIGAGHELLLRYREVNTTVRNAPAPAYFKELPRFEELLLGVPTGDKLRDLVADAERRFADNEGRRAEAEQAFTDMSEREPERLLKEIAEIEARVARRMALDDAMAKGRGGDSPRLLPPLQGETV